MKRFNMILGIVTLFFIFFTTCNAESRFTDFTKKSNIDSLEKYDGLENTIKGPFGITMPSEFFTTDRVTNIENSGFYYAEIDFALLDGDSYIIFDEGVADQDDYARPAIVLAVNIDDKLFRNYIIPFGNSNSNKISIGNELIELTQVSDSVSAMDNIKIVVFSEGIFTCDLATNSDLETLSVNDASSNDDEGFITTLYSEADTCYYTTDTIPVISYYTGNQQSVLAYIKITKALKSHTSIYNQYYGYLYCYYPTTSDILHIPGSPTIVANYWYSSDWCVASFDDGFYTTSSGDTFLWVDMSNVVVLESGYGTVTSGSDTWRIYPY